MSVFKNIYIEGSVWTNNISGNPISDETWAILAGIDQDVGTAGSPEFANLTITGNLQVMGVVTIIDTVDMQVKDNVIKINHGEAGAGVSAGSAGVQVDRGSLPNMELLYNEGSSWTVGLQGGVLGVDVFRVVEAADAAPTLGAMPGLDAAGRLSEFHGLTPGEVTQLQNINATVITVGQWAYLGNLDQDLTTVSAVQFSELSIDTLLNVTGSITWGPATVPSMGQQITNVSVAAAAGVVVVDTDLADVTITMPPTAQSVGKTYTVYFRSRTAPFNTTITADGTDLIDGVASVDLTAAGQHATLLCPALDIWTLL
jgi:hypothetical protein